MFDFEKLIVYQKAKAFHLRIGQMLKKGRLGTTINNQLHRASLSIVLNLAEGSGRFSDRDRKNFYVIARSSVFECVAILDILQTNGAISTESYHTSYGDADELSRTLLSMIKNLDNKSGTKNAG